MDSINDFLNFMRSAKTLTAENRPLRMRLAHPDGISDDVLLPQRVVGNESICGGLEYRIDCVATDARLELKQFIMMPVELQFVTDRGDLRKVCGIVEQAKAGRSDGGLATYQLVMRDALAIMDARRNTRVFRDASEIDIIETLLVEWRQKNSVLAGAFDIEFDQLILARQCPQREFTKQHNESDAGFIRRLLKRRGISWFFRVGRSAASANGSDGDLPAHTLVLVDDTNRLRENTAGVVRFHRDNATEQRDAITAWSAVRTLRPGGASRYSWNDQNPAARQFMATSANSNIDQGTNGNAMATCLNDYLVDIPNMGVDHEDQATLGRLRLGRYDFETKCFHGEGSVRDFAAGEWFAMVDHPEIDAHAQAEREFVITELFVVAENNLSTALDGKVRSLFERNLWPGDDAFEPTSRRASPRGAVRYRNRFTCVRRGIAIVPSFDPGVDVPCAMMESAIVVGPAGEAVHCDEQGRVKLRFPGTRSEDHQHAQGAGASDTDADSGWVRVASNWAGPGGPNQSGLFTLPPVGSEVLVAYLGGDPDRPIVVNQLYNGQGLPPELNSVGGLPGNKFLSGIQAGEVHGGRRSHLRLDATPGEISVQLASAHGASELNLGYLTGPRVNGEGVARGEGAELRSDKTVALRGGQGVLLSSGTGNDAQGAQLERAELIGMVDVLHGVADQLAAFAAAHAGDEAAGPQLTELIGRLKAWDSGSNVASAAGAQGAAGGAPIVVANAQAGMVMASHDSLVLGAANKIDMLCGGDTQFSIGRKLLLRATEGISLFAFRLGMKLIAANGDIRVQAQDGNVEITALKRIRLIAGEGVEIEAPETRIVTKGARADYGDGKITHQCTADYAVKSSRFTHSGAGNANPTGVSFPKSSLETDEKIILTERQTGLPIKAQDYTATLEDGQTVAKTTDAAGKTELLKSTGIGKVVINFTDG
jgi:type VI secretion system secreted protein VgrG